MSDILIRRAELRDAEALLAVYNHYVVHTPITFDIEPRTLEQRRAWLETFAPQGRYQCFVVDKNGVAIGWVSSERFKERAAYDTSVGTSIYLADGEHRKGYGRRLYTTLIEALSREDVHRMYGGITMPNPSSVALHEALGFRRIGTQNEVGRKFGKYWDVALYERVFDPASRSA